ncbi:MAG: hypothetical protein U9P71_02430 [Campylobacterota bacterium]|nr:hypothetical protein [Campylobacterota bacterium]
MKKLFYSFLLATNILIASEYIMLQPNNLVDEFVATATGIDDSNVEIIHTNTIDLTKQANNTTLFNQTGHNPELWYTPEGWQQYKFFIPPGISKASVSLAMKPNATLRVHLTYKPISTINHNITIKDQLVLNSHITHEYIIYNTGEIFINKDLVNSTGGGYAYLDIIEDAANFNSFFGFVSPEVRINTNIIISNEDRFDSWKGNVTLASNGIPVDDMQYLEIIDKFEGDSTISRTIIMDTINNTVLSTTQETQTKELIDYTYNTPTYKAKVQELKTELLATTASSVDEIADGNGLYVEYKEGYSGIIYNAPEGTKGSSSSSSLTNDQLDEQLTIFKQAALRTGNKKVLALAAQYFDWGSNDDVPQLATMLQANGFDVTYKHYDSKQSGIVNDFKEWGDYGIVLISTHGVARPEKSRTSAAVNVAIDTNIAPDKVSDQDLKDKKFILWSNCDNNKVCHDSLLASNLFFEEELSNLPNTLVYISACYVGKHDAMAELLFNKGAETMIGYSDLVKVSFAKEHGIDIFTRVMGDESVESIFELPQTEDISQGFPTGIKESDDTPAEIIVYQRSAVDYTDVLSSKTYAIAGSFASYDFAGVDKAFDWVFTTTGGSVFQLQGKEPTDKDVFGWSPVSNIANTTPAWYMFPLGEDIDGDGDTKFDWIFVGVASKAVYKLAGVSDEGTFMYSDKIEVNYSIGGNEVHFKN